MVIYCMSTLTPSQLAKKQQVEAAGGVFVPPSQYKKAKRGAVKTNPHQVATYSAKKKYGETYSRLSADTEQIVDQVLDPESASGNACRWPNSYGKSALYSCKNVINANFAADNRCSVLAFPQLKNAIFTTAGNELAVSVPPSDSNPITRNPFYLQEFSFAADEEVNMTSPWHFAMRDVAVPFPSEVANAMIYPIGAVFNTTPADTSSLFMNLYFERVKFAGQLSATIVRYDSTFVAINTDTVFCTNTGQINLPIYSSGLVAAAPSYLSVKIKSSGTMYQGECLGLMVTVLTGSSTYNVQALLANHSQHMVIYDIKDAETIVEGAEKAIIVSQSLLCTAQMSDITNGGAIAIARVPGGTVIGEGTGSIDTSNWYEWLASLATNNYDGAAKNGAYGFYLPDDERGYFYRDVRSYIDYIGLPYLATEFTVADSTEGSIMRIKVCTIVQFTTNSSTFQLAPSSVCKELDEAHHLLSLVNACYENDTHKMQLKKMMKQAGSKIKTILKNPKTWEKGGAALGILLSLLV